MANDDATLSELRRQETAMRFPGLPKRNPGLELANAFSVVCRTLSFHTTSKAPDAKVNTKLLDKSVERSLSQLDYRIWRYRARFCKVT